MVNKHSEIVSHITNDIGSTVFRCPACAKTQVVRTLLERKIAAKYVCKGCGFVGPN